MCVKFVYVCSLTFLAVEIEILVDGGMLVGGLEHFLFFHIFGIIIPID